eukprot:TRINITY_DN11855_c0_g1_i5.p1 TRINITY_DN11855_c0_g1~~TRINITY_DN11855_c0_g1_i5.p1  ORF type:complete len:834 (+),score=118.66 TRINITY_DN11855_c0_g1_i5:1-2502(+)
MAPSDVPSASPSMVPSASPSISPSALPSSSPSQAPSSVPSVAPSDVPSASPSMAPSDVPSSAPSEVPSASPSISPSALPSSSPSQAPSSVPSVAPSDAPSASPSMAPSDVPSISPSELPSSSPSPAPTPPPSPSPSDVPSASPSMAPSDVPSSAPSEVPSASPSISPSALPSSSPSQAPSSVPSVAPSDAPSASPSMAPSDVPSISPSELPSSSPSPAPTPPPSPSPSDVPSASPSMAPSDVPSASPSALPSASPSVSPSALPSASPSAAPSASPSASPSRSPSSAPSSAPSAAPSYSPSAAPSSFPTSAPTPLPCPTCSLLPYATMPAVIGANQLQIFDSSADYGSCVSNPSWMLACPSYDVTTPSEATCAAPGFDEHALTVWMQQKSSYTTEHPRYLCSVCSLNASVDTDDRIHYYEGVVTFGPNTVQSVVDETMIQGYRLYVTNESTGLVETLLAEIPKASNTSAPGSICCADYTYEVKVRNVSVEKTSGHFVVVPVMLSGAEIPFGREVLYYDVNPNPVVPDFDVNDTKWNISNRTVVTSLTVANTEITQQPTMAPTTLPTEAGQTVEVQKQNVTKVETNLPVAYTLQEFEHPVAQEATRCGMAASLGYIDSGLGCDPVEIANYSEIPARRLHEIAASAPGRRLNTQVDVTFRIEARAQSTDVVNELKNILTKVATSGSLVANIQTQAADKGVLTESLKNAPRQLAAPTFQVLVNVEKEVLVVVNYTAPEIAPPPADDSGDNAASVAIAVIVVVGIILCGIGGLAVISLRRKRQGNNPDNSSPAEAPANAVLHEAREDAVPQPEEEGAPAAVVEDIVVHEMDEGEDIMI